MTITKPLVGATSMSAREFNQNLAKAKREAAEAPVVVTHRGEPTHVLMSYEEFINLRNGDDGEDFVSQLMMKDPIDEDFEFEPVNIGLKPEES